MKNHIIGLTLLVMLFALSSCGTSRRASRGAPLVVKNSVTVDNNKIDSGDLSSLITVTTNKKLFGLFRARLWFYETFNGKKQRGEPPALLDSAAMYNTTRQMRAYLINSGFFKAAVAPEVKVKRGKAKVDFKVTGGSPYRYGEIEWDIHDTIVDDYILEDISSSYIKKNDIYNAYILDNERDRITKMLKNNGFYLFGKNFIRYEADSTAKSKRVNLKVIVDPFRMSGNLKDSTLYPHHQYYINNIYITPDYRPYSLEKSIYDTIPIFHKDNKDSKPYYFIETDPRRMHPNTILNTLLIKPGDRYAMDDVKQTQKRLSRLRIYKFANVEFTTPSSPSDTMLNCRVNLVRRPVHSTNIQTEVTNSSGNPGVGGNLIYENKNLLRRGEVFRLTLKGAVEAQATTYNEEADEYNLFNTLELGGNVNLVFPKFLFPGKKQFIAERFLPRTVLSGGYNFQRRPDYSRHITNVSFGYEWKSSQQTSHRLNPLEINSVKIYPDSTFSARLDQLQNVFYKSQYTDHMIIGINYSYVKSTQSININKNFSFLKLNFETSGNLLRAANEIVGGNISEQGYYSVFNIRYAQYIKGVADYRYYYNLPYKNQFVTRVRAGVGIPYGNSVVMPFEKGFFGGGSNDMRGWQIRTLGPGSFSNDTLYIERIGDIILETNIEYRFPIYKWFRGAIFADAGNIWLLNENEDFPGGKFEFKDFIKEFSISSGLGLRLDIDFFVIRIDGGIPIHDPALAEGDRWKFNSLRLKDVTWNFAIGYPF